MARGDRVRIVVDAGSGPAMEFVVEATKDGRRVDTTNGRGQVEVTELTRTGKVVRTSRFMASRVIALVDERVGEDEEEAQGPAQPAAPSPQMGLGLGDQAAASPVPA